MRRYLTVPLTYIFLISNDVEHFFMGLFAIHILAFGGVFFQIFAPY